MNLTVIQGGDGEARRLAALEKRHPINRVTVAPGTWVMPASGNGMIHSVERMDFYRSYGEGKEFQINHTWLRFRCKGQGLDTRLQEVKLDLADPRLCKRCLGALLGVKL